MTYSQTLVTSLKDAQGGISDYKTAQILGCTRQNISNIKNGISCLSIELGLKAAKLAKVDSKIALIGLLKDGSKNDEMKKILEDIEGEIRH
jgi:transcriptional regulator